MSGRNVSTLPTPAKIPSMTRLWTMGFIPYAVRARSASEVNESIPRASKSDSAEPITPNVSQNTRNITPKNTGSAVYFPVRTLSIAMLRRCSRLSCALTTESDTTLSMKSYLIAARAAFLSSPLSSSISTMQCSRSSRSFSSSSSLSSMSGSPSISFDVQNLAGSPARSAWSSMRWTTA